jgi:hypothetical protein
VEISISAKVAINENQTVLLMLFGNQQAGVAGFPVVVAATLVYNIELQLPTPTVIGIAMPQVSLAGCAKRFVVKLIYIISILINFKISFISIIFDFY